MSVRWVGTPRCDLDNSHPLGELFYDASLPLHGGRWGLVCATCAKGQFIELGTGKGQKYARQADGSWLKVAG